MAGAAFGSYGGGGAFGSYGRFGAMTTPAKDTELTTQQVAELTRLGIDIAQDVTGTPYKRYEVARAELQVAIAEGRPLSTITEKQAKLAAAYKAVQEYEATQASRWEWTNLGKTGAAVGIGVGVMIIALQFRALLRG